MQIPLKARHMKTASPALKPVQEKLAEHRDSVTAAVNASLKAACGDNAKLHHVVSSLVHTDSSQESLYRLLPFVFSRRGTDDALLVGTVSRIWWAGAETFDDINDQSFDNAAVGLSTDEALVGSTACITLLPLAIISAHGLPVPVEHALSREMTDTSLRAADGQLDDIEHLIQNSGGASWPRVMRSYVGKTGAAYGRDLAITALLDHRSSEEVTARRAFGQLFGVLRQMANDRGSLFAPDNEDFANGRYTLLLADALDTLPADERSELLTLHSEARHSQTARGALLRRLTRPDRATTYDGRILTLHAQLSALMTRLVESADSRAVAQWLITSSARGAMVDPPGTPA